MNVVAVVSSEDRAVALCRLAWKIARAIEGDLTVAWLPDSSLTSGESLLLEPDLEVEAAGEVPEILSLVLGAMREQAAVFAPRPQKVTSRANLERSPSAPPAPPQPLPNPRVEIRGLDPRRALQSVLELVDSTSCRYLLACVDESRPAFGVSLAGKLYRESPCNTLLLRLADAPPERFPRLLVPTEDGPHGEIALRLAARLGRAEASEITALAMAPPVGDADELGRLMLRRALSRSGLADDPAITTRVELADDEDACLAEVASENFDLLLLGAQQVPSLRARLFGSLPKQLFAREGLTVAVVRARWGLLDRFYQRLGRWLDLTVPQLDRDQRVAFFERLQTGSQWNFDFMALMAASTAIATLGLLQNSAAVVIGAMLVAPLMTPILGLGLSAVQANRPLLASASRALGLGYLMAFSIAFGLGLLVPISQPSTELLARGAPTLLDMGVGFSAGMAAAYCLGRPGLLAALPGVAIAAALVPPIATTGVSLARALLLVTESAPRWVALWLETATGAAVLFGTNVVSIVLGAAISLYGAGFRGKKVARWTQRWVRLMALGLTVVLIALAVYLAAPRKSIPPSLVEAVENRLQELGASLVEAELDGDRLSLRARSPEPLPGNLGRALVELSSHTLRRPITVEIATELVTVARP